jgi:hypothetical protein
MMKDYARVPCCHSRTCPVCAGTDRRVVEVPRARNWETRRCLACTAAITGPANRVYCSERCKQIRATCQTCGGRCSKTVRRCWSCRTVGEAEAARRRRALQ